MRSISLFLATTFDHQLVAILTDMAEDDGPILSQLSSISNGKISNRIFGPNYAMSDDIAAF